MHIFNLAFLDTVAADTVTWGEAGLNTVMGLGIVFLTLAFISILIAIEGKIFTAIAKKKAAPKVVDTPAPAAAPAVEEEELSDDEELVAVITAAIYAFEAEAGTAYVPADGLVVKSIRRRR